MLAATSPRSLSFVLLLLLTSLATPACAKREAPSMSDMAAAPAAAPAVAGGQAQGSKGTEAMPRKIVKNATLNLETGGARASREKATQVAERLGGYVVSSSESETGEGNGVNVSMTLKVPSEKLSEALGALRALGTKVRHESVTSEDVSAEFYDLEARLKAQRAIEAQLLEIAKEAKNVTDLLAVQKQLGEIRGEIERMEGRRNLLDRQASFSTVQLSLLEDAPDPSLGTTLVKASRDAREVTSAVLHGGIRLAGVLLPVGLLLGLPVFGFVRLLLWLQRRRVAR
ncbi:MAG: DUF4349 domain-containing protein [Polyangiaceae bacterium]|jgi:hypothetical protein|nr:DUF4349 domain-containing protein [Polyangiaceae bacterium]